MPFNIHYYFHRALFYLTIPMLGLLLYYFGNSGYLDWIYIGALVLSCVFCWADKNTLGALFILLGLWVLAQILFIVPGRSYYLFLIYTASLAISIYCIKRTTGKINLALTFLCVSAEFYWWNTNYLNRPEIQYMSGLLSATVFARELLLNRVFILHKYFGYHSSQIALDWQVRSVLLLDFILGGVFQLEYFLRHITTLNEMTVIYEVFPSIAFTLSALMLAIIYMHYFYNQSKKHIAA